jgi:hypothetical protein
MIKIKLVVTALLMVTLVVGVLPVFAGCGTTPPAGNLTPLLIGGSFGVTGAYPEDCLAVLAAFQDYAKWVNAHHQMSPWDSNPFPDTIELQVVSMDDGGTNTAWAISNYAVLKAQGLLVQRISGSGIANALKATLAADQVGATSQASGSYLLSAAAANRTIFMNYPIYTDQAAAIADWFVANWVAGGNTTPPNVSYLTNATFGTSLVPPATSALQDYLISIGYNITGKHVLPAAPTTSDYDAALTLCKNDNANLTLGAMLCSESEPCMVEAKALGMGPDSGYPGWTYNITFGLCSPSHLVVFLRDKGATCGNGLVVAGSYPSWTDTGAGVTFCKLLQTTYRPSAQITHVMYMHGLAEAMIQVEAMRLAMINTGKTADQLTSADVLNQGFRMITGLDTGGIVPTTITYDSAGDVEGAGTVRLDQAHNGADLVLGLSYALHHLYP